MQPKTVKRLAILIAVFGFIGGAGFITKQYQVTRLAKRILEKADAAVKAKDFEAAEKLYEQHMAVVRDDFDVQIKYADAYLKVGHSPARQNEAVQIYAGILKGAPGRADARRRLMQLYFDTGRYGEAQAELRSLRSIPANANDPELIFVMARCCEELRNDPTAVDLYQKVIDHQPPAANRIEASQRRATLLRGDRLKREEEAEQAIAAMVQGDPNNYLVYLARGRYYLAQSDTSKQKSLLEAAKADFLKAKELAPDKPTEGAPGKAEIYLEIARVTENESGLEAARLVLEEGLEVEKRSTSLYNALAYNELRSGHVDAAIKTLERSLELCDLRLMSSLKGVSDIPPEGKDLIIVAAVDNVLHFRIFDGVGKAVVDTDEKKLTKQAPPIDDLRKQLLDLWPPHELTASEKGRVISAVTSIVDYTGLESAPADRADLRLLLARVLADDHRDAGKLLLQIEELKRIGISPVWIQYLEAYYRLNTDNPVKARQILIPLQAAVSRSPVLKAMVNVLLAQCYRQLADPDKEATP